MVGVKFSQNISSFAKKNSKKSDPRSSQIVVDLDSAEMLVLPAVVMLNVSGLTLSSAMSLCVL